MEAFYMYQRSAGILAWTVALSALLMSQAVKAAPTECSARVREFLDRPTTAVSSKVRTCWSLIDESPNRFGRLLQLVAAGNRVAAQYLASNFGATDGGNAEDATIALSQFADHAGDQPLLELVQQGVLSEVQIQDIYGSTSPTFTDRLETQLDELTRRRARLQALHTVTLSKEKSYALDGVGHSISQVRAAMGHKP
ncbi:hypothetical protein [Phenylobacterium sp.]|uniref:hypothetical protein n=1 Tax=Phenylobacterium sp. TaxID=1871053 RepID=UPI001216EB52|nr:hypothetical protein [Phenylobacterium sp.]THD60772.1 MAG: hypothetical protein E8A49_13070 [Phenylobacterium sp.]